MVNGSSPVSVRSFNLIVNVKQGLIDIKTDSEAGKVTLSLKTARQQWRTTARSLKASGGSWRLETVLCFTMRSGKVILERIYS